MEDRSGAIVGGQVLGPDGLEARDLGWTDGAIVEEPDGLPVVFDARGALVLPGIVDLHGDAFERSIAPRDESTFDVGQALVENEFALLAAGVTTAFLSVTDSWEPGLRNRRTLHDLLGAVAARPWSVDTRVHVRHELTCVDEFDDLLGWMDDGRIDMVSLNDHGPHPDRPPSYWYDHRRRLHGFDRDETIGTIERILEMRPVGEKQVRVLAERANALAIPLAAHDTASVAQAQRELDLGVGIAEFPLTLELAAHLRSTGVRVLMGAPNLVRGSSHLGNVSVRDAVAAGVVDVLSSDYHYFSLLQAPFVLDRLGLLPLVEAWPFVAANAAEAAGLGDRGDLAVGRRADAIVVEPPTGNGVARVRAVVADGVVAARFA